MARLFAIAVGQLLYLGGLTSIAVALLSVSGQWLLASAALLGAGAIIALLDRKRRWDRP